MPELLVAARSTAPHTVDAGGTGSTAGQSASSAREATISSSSTRDIRLLPWMPPATGRRSLSVSFLPVVTSPARVVLGRRPGRLARRRGSRAWRAARRVLRGAVGERERRRRDPLTAGGTRRRGGGEA